VSVLDNGDAQAHGLGGHVHDGFCGVGWRGDLVRTHVRGFAILSCVSSQAQHSGREAGAGLGPGLAAIAAEDIDRQYFGEQPTSPRQERKW
jgi:predicted RNA methylase